MVIVLNNILGDFCMGWSPPKKVTVFVSFFILLAGFILAVIAMGIWDVPGFPLDGMTTGILALIIIFFSWLLFLMSVMARGL